MGVGCQGMKQGAYAPLCLQSRELTSTSARMIGSKPLGRDSKYASQVRVGAASVLSTSSSSRQI